MDDLPLDFEGCSRDCRKTGVHTLVWGRCEHAKEPPRQPPKFGWWRTVDGGDGFLSLVRADLPLVAVIPWVARLDVDEQHAMLEEAADAEDPAACIERWRTVALSRGPRVAINMTGVSAPRDAGGYSPGHVQAAYEAGRRQGRHEAG